MVTATKPRLSTYQEIVPYLVRSIRMATGEFLAARKAGVDTARAHRMINRHFAWLAVSFAVGKNRHLYDGSTDGSAAIAPLRSQPLRNKNTLPEALRGLLEAKSAIAEDTIVYDGEGKPIFVVPHEPTRISMLIVNALDECGRFDRQETVGKHRRSSEPEEAAFAWQDTDDQSGSKRTRPAYLKSPLALALEFLTVPDTPGSYAYALVTLRNYIFDTTGAYPESQYSQTSRKKSGRRNFRVQDIEKAFSTIITFTRPRFESLGRDPLSRVARSRPGTVLREFFALKEYFWLRFADEDARRAYCSSLHGEGSFEFVRSPHLDRLPDIGEIVNELWGIPLPIRGADTVFRGALKFSSEGGLVMALHGGPGSGKTTLSLAFGAYLAAFGIKTLFISAEEHEGDLKMRASSISPEAYRRLSFFPRSPDDWLVIESVSAHALADGGSLRELLRDMGSNSKQRQRIETASGARLPCNRIIVLDGIHELLSEKRSIEELRRFITECRLLDALVILTTGAEWAGDSRIDYLVDIAINISNFATNEYSRKPDRRFQITKARFQLCATGTHGFQVAGEKGVRFSPQINYQLDRRAIWKPRLPDFSTVKVVTRLETSSDETRSLTSKSVNIPIGSNIFINGLGSGGKAALALKLAMAPAFRGSAMEFSLGKQFDPLNFKSKKNLCPFAEKILVISFLYGREYYDELFEKLKSLRQKEMPQGSDEIPPYLDVIHLYPGYLKPNDLFNRIEWRLQAAELGGVPFSSVIIEGIHNVFLQFPELQLYPLFWPQLFSSLRTRPLTTITTHTNLELSFADHLLGGSRGSAIAADAAHAVYNIDDERSEPLRHALVQQTDFSFEVTPRGSSRNIFDVRVKSAIGQSIPQNAMQWSRDALYFVARDLLDATQT
ncbi:RAD55 family ATPase [Bradyrhizobium symbiodeficiens]|uniref:RAD55 family ATPase n=1 Tax=Bradyrhizobium symbiodeficiens TaxID=1404367 RepID=UPI000BA1C129|nr:ATPase domain-containing protein [Bradyrhizobium symbiodeficiens]AWM07723.1 hypothetical protein CIT39_15560 [Bradyrhizobium symbiodeficiens]